MELRFVLESMLFAAQKPMTAAELRGLLSTACEHSEEDTVRSLKRTKLADIEATLDQLAKEITEANRSYRLVCVAGAWQFVSQIEYAPWLKALAGEKARPPRLSQPALETLTIIAYRQPITRAEMEQIRGVSVDGVMQTLVERGLVTQMGRAEVVGRPITYGTTALFLEYFGLRDLDDLPAADELRRIPVEHPPSLLTAENAPAPEGGQAASTPEAAPAAREETAPTPEPTPSATEPTLPAADPSQAQSP